MTPDAQGRESPDRQLVPVSYNVIVTPLPSSTHNSRPSSTDLKERYKGKTVKQACDSVRVRYQQTTTVAKDEYSKGEDKEAVDYTGWTEETVKAGYTEDDVRQEIRQQVAIHGTSC